MSHEKKPHLSHSQISMYTKCGEAYRRRYLEGEKRPPGIALLVGSGVHTGIEENFRQKIETREDLTKEQVAEIAVEGAMTRFDQDGIELTGDEKSIGRKKALATIKDQTASLARAATVQVMPFYQPQEVEVTTVIELPHLTRDLVCITDFRGENQEIRDFKTAARRYADDAAKNDLQLTIEAAAYRVDHGVDPVNVGFEVIVKNKNPTRQQVLATRGEQDYGVLAGRVQQVVDGIDKGVFIPADPGHWACSAKWCGYYSTCRYVKKG